MNIFGWYFLMHVLERKNEESFDLVEFVASVNQVNFVAHFPSNRRFFLLNQSKCSHRSRIVLRGNVTREFGHNYDDDEGNKKIKKKDHRFKQSKNAERAAQSLADCSGIIAFFPFRESADSEIQEIFAWNSKSWALESGMPLMMGIRNPSFNDKSPESWTWNSESTASNPESESVLMLGLP